jgi:small-conductance mechanosensitive channel
MRFAVPIVFLSLLVTPLDLHAQRPVSDDEILQYLRRTIGWYRDESAMAQSPADGREAVFADGLRQSSTETVRAAFQFAHAQAAIPVASTAESPQPDRSRTLAQSAAAAEQRAEQAQAEIEQINRQLETAPERSRARLRALRDEVTSEANFARARRDALRSLLGFLSAGDEGGLAARVAELERSVPEALATAPKPAATAAAPEFHPESAGIVGLIAEVFSASQQIKRLDRLAQETEALRQAGEKLRSPLRAAMRDVIQRGDALSQAPESSDVAALSAQKKELDAVAARFKQLSASSVPLSEQAAAIASARGRILEWRASLAETYASTWRYLLLRLMMLAVALAIVLGLSELWRRGTMRYVQDVRRRRQFLLMRRVVVGCAIVVIVVLGFVTEFGSLATFAGFSAAGIAVAMQSVLLSVVAYFFLVGRWGVRVGDRVTVSGVTGEVADIGLFRLYLMELEGSGVALHPTGRMVVFPNSVFFQPAALFKQLPGVDYVWRSLTLKLPAAADYEEIERKLMNAVESLFAEYRENVERQHRTVVSSLDVHTAAPRPESRVRFGDGGLEITIRYPVEIGRAAEIDDRIAREVIRQAGGAAQVEASAD